MNGTNSIAPNDEALENHPLYERGLGFYGVCRIDNSSWPTALDTLGSAKHAIRSTRRPPATGTHWIVTMKERIFECVARELTVEIRPGSVRETLATIALS